MSNGNQPAENVGGKAAAPTADVLTAIPPRIRVHALAKLLGKTSKELLATLAELGETAGSAQSSVSREVAHKAAETYGITPEPGEPAAEAAAEPEPEQRRSSVPALAFAAPAPMFLPPDPAAAKPAKPAKPAKAAKPARAEQADAEDAESADVDDDTGDLDEDAEQKRRRRRRGRRGRGRGKGGDGGPESGESEDSDSDADEDADDQDESADADSDSDSDTAGDDGSAASRRRRRRRRRKTGGEDGAASSGDDPPNTVVHVRDSGRSEAQAAHDQVRSVRGSTRLEAKRQRRRDGREAGRRRVPILSEAEFLARRESVARTMVVKESASSADRTTQIGVLEDDVLVEHFVTSSGSGSIVGNVYLGRVQNVLPSMEAAFVDIGRGRNAVLYAGEVDWDAAGLEGKSRKIEQALSSGDLVLVQVTKDPVGHKGARLTTQISLPGRYLVYVPGGGATGISRKLPENERRRLKDILKRVVPDDAGVIIRTASEGIIEEELERDVRRLQSVWQTIDENSAKGRGANGKGKGGATLLHEEPDLLVKVVRDLFTEDFAKLVVQGDVAWETINSYVQSVAPDLSSRLERYVGTGDVFADYRIDEQITKALDRKVWLPSGGYLVIDRTEAMTVIDVNTGKYTGSGGNLEETVTRNNLESAEEVVRQLRLRDIGGIIVIDFIDMVLESNRDLVLRRLTECLSRDRTRHQVAEVTSLGLVQMTRKRVGTGLLEAFSAPCEHCKGRGVVVTTDPHPGTSGGDSVSTQPTGRKRGGGKAKAAPVLPEPTPEQRETVATAVAAIASAAQAAATKTPAEERAEKRAEKRAEERAAQAAPAASAVQELSTNGVVTSPEAATGDGQESRSKVAETPEVPQAAEAPEEPEAPEVPVPAVRTVRRRARRAASRPAGPPVGGSAAAVSVQEPDDPS